MDFGDILGDGGFGELNDQGEDGQVDDLMMFGLNTQEIEEMKHQKDSVIFLIDCHRSMQQPNPHNGADEQSNIEQVLKATHSFVKTKIISNENDKIGIVLYGCAKDGGRVSNSNSLNFTNLHVLYSLDIPDAGLIKQLEIKVTTFEEDHGFFDESTASSRPAEPDQINSTGVAYHMGSTAAMGSSLIGSTASQLGANSSSGFGPSSSATLSSARSPLYEALWICA